MTEPTPFQRRAAQLRETNLQQQLGSLALTLAQVMAERDAYAEEVARVTADNVLLQTELVERSG